MRGWKGAFWKPRLAPVFSLVTQKTARAGAGRWTPHRGSRDAPQPQFHSCPALAPECRPDAQMPTGRTPAASHRLPPAAPPDSRGRSQAGVPPLQRQSKVCTERAPCSRPDPEPTDQAHHLGTLTGHAWPAAPASWGGQRLWGTARHSGPLAAPSSVSQLLSSAAGRGPFTLAGPEGNRQPLTRRGPAGVVATGRQPQLGPCGSVGGRRLVAEADPWKPARTSRRSVVGPGSARVRTAFPLHSGASGSGVGPEQTSQGSNAWPQVGLGCALKSQFTLVASIFPAFVRTLVSRRTTLSRKQTNEVEGRTKLRVK